MDDIHDEGWFKALTRMARETRAPLERMLLKKVGLSLLDIRVRLEQGKAPIKVVSHLWESSSLLTESYWRVPIQPVPIQTLCTSDKNQAVANITLFVEIPSEYSDLQFLDIPSRRRCYWSNDYFKIGESNRFELLVLEKGAVQPVGFGEINRIGPNPDQTAELLRRTKAERDAVLGAMLKRKMLKPIDRTESSSRIADELISISDMVTEAIKKLSVSVVITLDDSTLLPFEWDYTAQEYVKGFFTGGLTTA